MRRLAVLLTGLALLVPGCGEAHQDIRTVRSLLSRTEARPHVLRYEEVADGHKLEVVLKVQDSFRSQATLTFDDQPLLAERLVDDAVAVRLLSPGKWNPAEGSPLASILGSGRWVIDPAGAPPVLFAESDRVSVTDTGRDPLFDATNGIEYVRSVVATARRVRRFNKESLEYRPQEDPFRDRVDDDERAGLTRYDALPPILPRSEDQARGQLTLPDDRFFRKLSVYVKDSNVVRVLEAIDFEHHEEYRKAVERGRPRFLLQQLKDLREGLGDDPIRPRRMSIEVVSVGSPVEVALPGDAITANLGSLLESNALAELPGIRPQQTATPVLPQPDGSDPGSV